MLLRRSRAQALASLKHARSCSPVSQADIQTYRTASNITSPAAYYCPEPAPPVASTSKLPPRRAFSTSHRRAFVFFGLKSRTASDPAALAARFQTSLDGEDPVDVASTYASLRRCLLENPQLDPASIVTHEDLSRAIQLLASTSHIYADFEAAQTMFWDLKEVWELGGRVWSDSDHLAYIKALARSRQYDKALRWLEMMATGLPASKADWQLCNRSGTLGSLPQSADVVSIKQAPSPQHWQAFFGAIPPNFTPSSRPGSRTVSTHEYLMAIFRHKVPKHLRTVEMYMVALRSLFSDPAMLSDDRASAIPRLLDHVNTDGLADTPLVSATLLQGYVDVREWQEARHALGKLETYPEQSYSKEAWHAVIAYRVACEGEDAAVSTLTRMRSFDHTLNTDTLVALLTFPTLPSLDQVRERLAWAEHTTRLSPDSHVYAAAIGLVSAHDTGTPPPSLALYEAAKAESVPTSSAMVKALVRGPRNHTHLPQIQQAYNDLLQSSLAESRGREGIYDMELYIELLNFCARRSIRDVSWALQLLEDVRTNGLSFVASETYPMGHAASIVTELMRIASKSHSEAFKAYSWMYAIHPEETFDASDYTAMIRTFSDLDLISKNSFFSKAPTHLAQPSTPEKPSWCPLEVFTAFFDDMRKIGLHPRSEDYQAVLHYYARTGRWAGGARDAITKLHSTIRVDQYVDPDIGLMNRLMYAYCRCGLYDDALGVWRSILLNQMPFNDVSLSVVFDIFGFTGQSDQARRLWAALKVKKHKLRGKVLESYLESLCRAGRVREALDVVLVETDLSRTERTGRTIPFHTNMLEILVKFSRRDASPKVWQLLKETMSARVPQAWAEVEHMESSRAAKP